MPPPTLAELTLELSRDLSELEARCHDALSDAERRRDESILSGAGRAVLVRYYEALEAAREDERETLEKAATTRERKVNDAEISRQDGIRKAETKYREAQTRAERKRRDQARKARERHRKAYEAAGRAPLVERHRARRAADEALEQALTDARETYDVAVEDARLDYRATVQDELAEERLAIGRAEREAEKKARAASVAYERFVARQEIQLRRELNAFPAAKNALDAYDEAVFETEASCEAEKTALFAEFERKREELARRDASPRARKK